MTGDTLDAALPERYWAAVAAGDPYAARRLALDALDGGIPVLDVLERLVLAAQAEVGRRWAADEWSVAQEHRATSISEDVVAALAARVPDPPPEARTIVMTCADREWHALPARALSLVFCSAGWQVIFLGAAVPVAHLASLLQDVGPDLTALSCTVPPRLFEAREMIEVSRDAGIPVLVGGRGFGTDGRWARVLGANAWAPDARAACALLRDAPPAAFTSPAPQLRAPDDDLAHLRGRRRAIAAASLSAMSAALPDVARYDRRQRARTEEDVEHILDFLAAALFVDDVTLFTEFVSWLAEILAARGVPGGTLRAGLEMVAGAVEAEAGPHSRSLDFLAAGAAEVPTP